MKADEKYRQRDIDFLEDCNDEIFLAFEIEYQRRFLAAMAKQLPVQNAHEATNL